MISIFFLKTNYYRLIFIIFSFIFTSSSFAAVIHWSPVESTENCVIAGYKLYYAKKPIQSINKVNIVGQNNSFCDLDTLNLVPGQVYRFAVKACSTTNQVSPLSSIITYTPTQTDSFAVSTYSTTNQKDSLNDDDNDDDNDGMADDWEAYYGINMAFLDSDSDGLDNRSEFKWGTSPVDDDSDNDGMADGWEVQYGLNPLLDDADADLDSDGISNIDEYIQGLSVSNRCPDTPVLNLPGNFADNVKLNPQLITNSYVDHESDDHVKTQWQISTEQTFTIPENILYDRETYNNSLLTTLIVPEFISEIGGTYFWRVRFFDELSGSLWSEPFSFTTIVNDPADSDQDGIPDVQEVIDGTIDLNNDGEYDVSSNAYKMVTNGTESFAFEALNNVTAIEYLKSIDSADIADIIGKPDNLDFGLLQFKVRVSSPGETANIKIYFSEPAGTDWYKYDIINGWTEYSMDYPNNVNFSSDGKSVLLTLVDGGDGDSDGVANGIIVDQSCPGGSF